MAILRAFFRVEGYFNLSRLSPKNNLKGFLGREADPATLGTLLQNPNRNYHWRRNYYRLYSEKIKACKKAGLHYSN